LSELAIRGLNLKIFKTARTIRSALSLLSISFHFINRNEARCA
jgi:hypothetical protein